MSAGPRYQLNICLKDIELKWSSKAHGFQQVQHGLLLVFMEDMKAKDTSRLKDHKEMKDP